MVLVDTLVTMSVEWTGPGGMLSPNGPVMAVNSSRYTSSITLDSVGPTGSGMYTCRADVSSASQFITGTQTLDGSTTITIGKREWLCYFNLIVLFIVQILSHLLLT